MTGKLQKIDDNWFVSYKMDSDLIATDGGLILLHPDDVEQIRLDSIVFDNIEARIGNYPYVEFHFYEIWEEIDGETGVTKYAKLGPAPKNKYPELEGTNALCEDIIEKRTGKMTEEEWVAAERGEISDEEIEKAAEKETCYMSDFIKGAKWYKEQLKQKAK